MNNSELCEIAKKYESRGDIENAYQCYLEAAMAENDGEAMKALAQMYFEGNYVHENYDKAGKYYGMAYDQRADIEPWTLIIAGCYWEKQAEGNEQNLLYAIKYYQAAADLGEGYGYECLGKKYYDMGEYEKAYEYLTKEENLNSCGFYYLGRLYDEGLGVEQDKNKAIELYQKAVESGLKYEKEYGEDEDCAKAKERLKVLGVDYKEVQ